MVTFRGFSQEHLIFSQLFLVRERDAVDALKGVVVLIT